MSRILLPSTGAPDWQRLLAKPELHWSIGRSARTLAHAWEGQPGLPPEIQAAFDALFPGAELLFAIPEHKTPLPGGHRESQSDLLALVRSDLGLITATIEGKVDEPFGPTIADWDPESSPGRRIRYDYLCDLLGLICCPTHIHYQLLHRTASALTEAKRFGAPNAAMVVHSFSPEKRWFEAYAAFLALFNSDADPDKPQRLDMRDGTILMLAWVTGEQRYRLA